MRTHKKLKPEERDQIAILQAQGKSMREIARRLNRSPSTISDELQRGKDSKEEYVAIHAQYLSEERKKHSHKRLPLKNERVYGYVLEGLRTGWSPEQISGRIEEDYPEEKEMRISWETIYSYIYKKENKEIRLWEYLPRKRKKRKQKQGRKVHRSKIISRVSIHKRSIEIEKRKEFGHWEGDTVEGKNHKGGVHTEVERKSRLTLAQKVERIDGKSTMRAQMAIFKQLPLEGRKTTTLDNGKENHLHLVLRFIKMKTYFADPYSSWQRGTNEYHNGLLRRYFPKKTDFDKVTQEEIDEVIYEINNRPRKVLGFKTPIEVFNENLQSVRIIT